MSRTQKCALIAVAVGFVFICVLAVTARTGPEWLYYLALVGALGAYGLAMLFELAIVIDEVRKE